MVTLPPHMIEQIGCERGDYVRIDCYPDQMITITNAKREGEVRDKRREGDPLLTNQL